ncbi:MAG: copper chaperone Copz family protein [Euryarchaeota archaeon]|nr:copper chaperone Copz family protein [Euryarchaeota archaeon]
MSRESPPACECPPEAGAATCEVPRASPDGPCPACGKPGKPVDLLTVKAMLAVPLTELRATRYRFCKTPECPMVYYGVDADHPIGETALRERVHQKHPEDDDVFVCYCFRHTPATIRAEVESTGRSTVVEAITAGIQAGRCACEVRNPQGSCCLGNVRAVVENRKRKGVIP